MWKTATLSTLSLFILTVINICTATALPDHHRPDSSDIPIEIDEPNISPLNVGLEPSKVADSLLNTAGPEESFKFHGVDPSQREKYLSGNKFQCNVSETETILLDRERINDDYCDCIDGTDEPGQSPAGSK